MQGTWIEGLEPLHKPPTCQTLLKGACLTLSPGSWPPAPLLVYSQKDAWVGVSQPTLLRLELLGVPCDRALSSWLHL